MRKQNEVGNPSSCLNRAVDGEMLFVLLGRDAAAPATIRFWVNQRLQLGKNQPSDEQIVEALACAKTMEEDQWTAKKLKSSPSA